MDEQASQKNSLTSSELHRSSGVILRISRQRAVFPETVAFGPQASGFGQKVSRNAGSCFCLVAEARSLEGGLGTRTTFAPAKEGRAEARATPEDWLHLSTM